MKLYTYPAIRSLIYKLFTVVLFTTFFFWGCSPSAQLLNDIPVNSAEIKVLNQNNEPIEGAQVEASNGRKSTTDSTGVATIRFGTVGLYTVSVIAENYMPSNFTLTMPSANNETFTRHLSQQVNYTGMSGMNFGSANMYPMMFSYLFSSYGYGLELDSYEESEMTKWKITTEGDGLIMKKAFLKKLDNGKEWWQIALLEKESENPQYIAEVLFSENRKSILRYREQVADGEIQEKPVSEGWYSQPTELTQESIEGAKEKTNVSVETPAGTFKTDLLNFGVTVGTSLKMWRVDKGIPGGVVKYQTTREGEVLYESELLSYGNDAKSLLNSF
ncbi:carboxypeptidase-like regulatory domain-containing protein [Fodinibius sp. AD559]|uniref:carboxypeptidase-like regulatory domain-containing protein n=1 Tax=Fodinibius sp. AD559 TaxID=3424179 RepID=UPI004046A5B9